MGHHGQHHAHLDERHRPRTRRRNDHPHHPRQTVGALWLFAILCYLYCDVLATHDASYLRDLLDGDVGGIVMTPGFLLGASVLMTIPIAAVLVTRVAPHWVARTYSIVAGAVMTFVQAGSLFFGSGPTPSYLWFSALEIAATATIVWFSLTRWARD